MHERTSLDAPAPAPVEVRSVPAPLVFGAAAASVGAGLVHAAAAGTHTGADTLVRLFAVTAAAQVLWAAVAVLRPGRAVLVAGGLLNGGAAVAWALSRTRGLPWPAELEAVEEVGTQDLLAALLGGLAALAALGAIVRPRLALPRSGPIPGMALLAGAAAIGLAVPAMAAPHTHGPSHEHGHDHGDEAAAADVTHAHTHATSTEAATGPIISLDDSRVAPDQRAAAQALIDTTRAAMAEYSDTASVEAAGYVSIGDQITGHEHFINVGYIADGVDMDPDRVESIVFQVNPDGSKELVSAMYILAPGKTMDDVPDIAGELTTWHDHQNLCWEGVRVVGTTDATGRCERGTFRGTPPMLHVWLVDNPCGPFAGLEGHGTDCGHHH